MLPITHTISVYRFVTQNNKDGHSSSPAYTGVGVTIVPASNDIVAMYGQPAHIMFTLYVDREMTFTTGDKIVAGTDVWYVRGTEQKYMAWGLVVLEATLQKIYNQ